jgi:hypothetical protein
VRGIAGAGNNSGRRRRNPCFFSFEKILFTMELETLLVESTPAEGTLVPDSLPMFTHLPPSSTLGWLHAL